MIRSPRIDPKRPIDLLDENQAHQLVRVGHFAEGDLGIAALHDVIA